MAHMCPVGIKKRTKQIAYILFNPLGTNQYQYVRIQTNPFMNIKLMPKLPPKASSDFKYTSNVWDLSTFTQKFKRQM